MRLERSRRSENVEDRRGTGLPRGVRIGGAGGIGLLLLVVLAVAMGVDPTVLLEQMGESPSATAPSKQPDKTATAPDSVRDFVSAVLAETEDVWTEVFRSAGGAYVPPRLVLFTGAVDSACGMAQSAVGPFYCPLDRKIYLDYSFFRDLERLGASGDFAEAYVIAHEVGHHVQTLLGTSERVQGLQARASPVERNALSVRFELQADCLAGVWAKRADRTNQILETGDVQEGLNAASAVGDDRIQQRTRGQVVPDSFTHGSSAQRTHWFSRGLRSGAIDACDMPSLN